MIFALKTGCCCQILGLFKTLNQKVNNYITNISEKDNIFSFVWKVEVPIKVHILRLKNSR